MIRNIKQFLFIAGLLLIAAGAQPVGAAIWQWSTAASSNATADPSINWAEGMAPSAVNDSARAMMAALAAWRNDISAVNSTAGTSTAYTLTTSEGVNTTPAAGQMLSFIAHVTNGASPTLQVDGGNTYPIWLNGSAVGAASLVIGTPYRISFSTSNSAWLLEGGYGNPYSIPLGGLMPSTVSTPPNSNFIIPTGQCISTTTYAAYWVAMGSPASGGCAGGQFAVLDLQGRVLAALDGTGTRMTNAATGCGTAFNTVGAVCANGNQSRTLAVADIPSHTHANSLNDPGHSHTVTPTRNSSSTNSGNTNSVYPGSINDLTMAMTANSNTTGISITNASAGGGGAHSIVQPTIGVVYFLRVL